MAEPILPTINSPSLPFRVTETQANARGGERQIRSHGQHGVGGLEFVSRQQAQRP
jgi:hypothetical protein